MLLKRLIKRLAHALGYEIRRVSHHDDLLGNVVWLCRRHHIGLCLDVGASDGHFARALRDRGFSGHVVSFEPLAEAHGRLSHAAAGDPCWHVAGRCAIGAGHGRVAINVAGNSWSSSLLPMLPRHLERAPRSRTVGRETVPLLPLDEAVAGPGLPPVRDCFLKIDTQGCELEVLRGASATLAETRLVLVEMSLVPLFDGAPEFTELYDRLRQLGFRCIGFAPGFFDQERRETYQVDGLFSRLPT